MSADDQYSLQHEFSDGVTARGVKNVENVIAFVRKETIHLKMIEIVMLSTISQQGHDSISTTQLLSCTESSKTAYKSFDKLFKENRRNYLTLLLKRRQTEEILNQLSPWKYKEQNLKALKYIDYAHLQTYDIGEPSKYELAAVTLCFTKENELRNREKHDLMAKLQVSLLKYVPIDGKKARFCGICKERSHRKIKIFD